jgi:hypothetical protein
MTNEQYNAASFFIYKAGKIKEALHALSEIRKPANHLNLPPGISGIVKNATGDQIWEDLCEGFFRELKDVLAQELVDAESKFSEL